MKIYKGYRFKKDNKMRGAYGDWDGDKKIVRINKKLHKNNKKRLANTIIHEKMHINHPKMWEKTVAKKTSRIIKKSCLKKINRINKII
jgi:hypothetical protein